MGSPPVRRGNDPRFPTCGAANDAGYGPYRRGVDPEYEWYQDRDGDGVVCERWLLRVAPRCPSGRRGVCDLSGRMISPRPPREGHLP
ncbi:excalibur calcium-binding domain-containing protein [Streptosporangium carneum]|uniref:excalibur calcium-binding domain-containing protein n=1 Tax=Streptosporangium carneum TaxID=47481 RepID=UPI0022F2FC13|nr:excalibur calcium-binding domain-containing protein [Streptosporangium carneum]